MDISRLTLSEAKREDILNLMQDYGHHLWVQIPVETEHGTEWRTILNNGIVYHPQGSFPAYLSSNVDNADRAIEFVITEVAIYSSVFNIQSKYRVI